MNADVSTIDTALPSFPQGQVLKGKYIGALRSKKGKLKGMLIHTGEATCSVKLPKYLRPVLAWELTPEAFVQIWAYPDEEEWRAVNILPLPEVEIAALQRKWGSSVCETVPTPLTAEKPPKASANVKDAKLCIQVCRKGKCYKQGGKHIWSVLQAEVEANPDLQHVSIEATGCMKACKQGPNLKVLPKGKLLSRITPDRALAVLSDCQ